MERRGFLGALAGAPLLGGLKPAIEPMRIIGSAGIRGWSVGELATGGVSPLLRAIPKLLSHLPEGERAQYDNSIYCDPSGVFDANIRLPM